LPGRLKKEQPYEGSRQATYPATDMEMWGGGIKKKKSKSPEAEKETYQMEKAGQRHRRIGKKIKRGRRHLKTGKQVSKGVWRTN